TFVSVGNARQAMRRLEAVLLGQLDVHADSVARAPAPPVGRAWVARGSPGSGLPSPRPSPASGRGGMISELDLGPGLVGTGEQVALAEVAAEADQRVALGVGLDALGDDLDAELAAQADDRPEQLRLHRRAIDA